MEEKKGARKVFLQIFMALGSPLFLLAIVALFFFAFGAGYLVSWILRPLVFWPFAGYLDFLVKEVVGCFVLSFLAIALARR